MITFSVNQNQKDVIETIVTKTDLFNLSKKGDNFADLLSEVYLRLQSSEVLTRAQSKEGNLVSYILTTAKGIIKTEQKRVNKLVAIVDDTEDTDNFDMLTVPSGKITAVDNVDAHNFKMLNEVEHVVNDFMNTREYIMIETGVDIFRLMQLLQQSIDNDDKMEKIAKLNAAKKMQDLAKSYVGLKELVLKIMLDPELFIAISDILANDAGDEENLENLIWVA